MRKHVLRHTGAVHQTFGGGVPLVLICFNTYIKKHKDLTKFHFHDVGISQMNASSLCPTYDTYKILFKWKPGYMKMKEISTSYLKFLILTTQNLKTCWPHKQKYVSVHMHRAGSTTYWWCLLANSTFVESSVQNFMSPFWHLEFVGGSYNFGTLVNLWQLIWRIT